LASCNMGLDGALGDAKHVGGLLIAQVEVVAQSECHALRVGQALHRLIKVSAQVDASGFVARQCLLVGMRPDHGAASSDRLEKKPVRDAVEPCAKTGVGAKLLELAPRQ